MAREDYEAAAQYVKDFLDLDVQATTVQDQVEGTQAEQQNKVRPTVSDSIAHLHASHLKCCCLFIYI